MLATQFTQSFGVGASLVGAYFVDNEVAVCLIAIPSLREEFPLIPPIVMLLDTRKFAIYIPTEFKE
jgi:hypothetical protein